MQSQRATTLLFVFFCSVCCPATAQEWPARQVQVVVPYGPGGVTDSMARVASEFLSKELGQPFVIDNRGGAGGVVGTQSALRAARDGYTILFASSTQVTVAPLIHKITYDPADLIPVSIVGQNVMGFVANSGLGVKSLQELIAYVKARPGKLNYATGGVGTNSHIAAASFANRAGLDMVSVPYSSGPQAISAVLSGDVQFYFGNLSDSIPLLDTGKLRLMAVTSEERHIDFPHVPAVAESLPGFSLVSWNGYFRLKGTSPAILKRLEGAVMKALVDDKVRMRLKTIGVDPVGSSAEQMSRSIEQMLDVTGLAVKAAGLKRN